MAPTQIVSIKTMKNWLPSCVGENQYELLIILDPLYAIWFISIYKAGISYFSMTTITNPWSHTIKTLLCIINWLPRKAGNGLFTNHSSFQVLALKPSSNAWKPLQMSHQVVTWVKLLQRTFNNFKSTTCILENFNILKFPQAL